MNSPLLGCPHGIDAALAELEVLELGRRADVVGGELDQLAGRQKTAPGVADQDVDAADSGALQPWQDPLGESRVVPAVAGQDDVDVGRFLVQYVTAYDRDPVAVSARIELDRGSRKRVDVCAGGDRRSGTQRGDRAQSGAGTQVEHAAIRHGFRVLAQIPPDRESAAPREGPVRQGGIRIAGLELDGVPERQHLVSQVETDLVEAGNRSKTGVAQDEGAGRGGDRWLL